MSEAKKYGGCDRHNKFNPSCRDCFAPTEAKPAAYRDQITIRIANDGSRYIVYEGRVPPLDGQVYVSSREAQERERLLTEALELQKALMKNLMVKGNIDWGKTFGIDFGLMNEALIKTDVALAKIRGTNG